MVNTLCYRRQRNKKYVTVLHFFGLRREGEYETIVRYQGNEEKMHLLSTFKVAVCEGVH